MKLLSRKASLAIGVIGVSVGLLPLVLWQQATGATEADLSAPAIASPGPFPIAALGRVEPRHGLIRIAGPARPTAVIGLLRVASGDVVAPGQVLAELDDKPQLEAVVERLRAELRDAEQQQKRFQRLHRDGVVSTSELESVQLRTAVATAELRRAQAQLEQSLVRSPMAGTILDIYTRRGERIAGEGLLLLADTRQMDVLAEVYESDAPHLVVGAPATISSPVLPAPIVGHVERIGQLVGKQRAFDLNPAAAADRRVVEVRIALEHPDAVAALSNLQVDVSIDAPRKES